MDEDEGGIYLNAHHILTAVSHIPSLIHILHTFLKKAVINLYSVFVNLIYLFF